MKFCANLDSDPSLTFTFNLEKIWNIPVYFYAWDLWKSCYNPCETWHTFVGSLPPHRVMGSQESPPKLTRLVHFLYSMQFYVFPCTLGKLIWTFWFGSGFLFWQRRVEKKFRRPDIERKRKFGEDEEKTSRKKFRRPDSERKRKFGEDKEKNADLPNSGSFLTSVISQIVRHCKLLYSRIMGVTFLFINFILSLRAM